MNENKEPLFHPNDEKSVNICIDKDISDNKQHPIVEHINTHYRKYLFFGFFGGFILCLIVRITFDKDIINNQINANEDSAPEIIALSIFDQAMAFAHEKDLFFHQSGKIYTLTGETLFKKYDTMFHMLDNAYHQSIDIKERLIRAKRFMEFIKIQDALFMATEYVRTDKDIAFKKLDEQFSEALANLQTTPVEISTGTIENKTGTNSSSTNTGKTNK